MYFPFQSETHGKLAGHIVMWPAGGWEIRWAYFQSIPPSSLLKTTILGIVYFCGLRILKLVGERVSRTSGLELVLSHDQLEHSSRHSLNHTVNVVTCRPLGLKDLQSFILIFLHNFGDASLSRYRKER